MKLNKKAFTLIELLVVIAIIAILAAILFPVFASARVSAMGTVTISNMKQIGTAIQMYVDDQNGVMFKIRDDDGRRSWKHGLQPYAKSAEVFKDPLNPGARIFDEQAVMTNPVKPRFYRGYFYYRPFFKTGNWQDVANYTARSVHEPAKAIVVAENKDVYPDYGPWIEYLYNGKGGWNIPNWGGGRRDDRSMVTLFMDGHSKNIPLRLTCQPDNAENMWQYTRGQWVYDINGSPTSIPWLDTFCNSLPF
jgi:prepilin-type N-terminal cleavage/methylation domain-containing protein